MDRAVEFEYALGDRVHLAGTPARLEDGQYANCGVVAMQGRDHGGKCYYLKGLGGFESNWWYEHQLEPDPVD